MCAKFLRGVLAAALALSLVPALAFADGGMTTFSGYSLRVYREESYGLQPNGEESMDGCHLELTLTFDEALVLSDAEAAAASFVTASGVSVMDFSNPTVSVSGKTLVMDASITYMPGGVLAFDMSEIAGLTCGGKAVEWPSTWKTVVPTGLEFHVVEVNLGTATTPASTTIQVDKSAVVRSMNHILWTSNGTSILQRTGTAQTTAAHHHNYWMFTLATSAYYIGVQPEFDDYTVTWEDDTVTITANEAVEGEYLGIYNYDDNFLQEYGFTLSDTVSGMAVQVGTGLRVDDEATEGSASDEGGSDVSGSDEGGSKASGSNVSVSLSKPVIKKLTVGKKKLKVKWNRTGATKYKVSWRVKGAKNWNTCSVSGTSVTLKKLKAGKKYQVKVTAIAGSKKKTSAIKLSKKIKK